MSVLSTAGSRKRVRFGQWISATTWISWVLKDTVLLSSVVSHESFLSNTTLLLCLVYEEREKERKTEREWCWCVSRCVCLFVCVCVYTCLCVYHRPSLVQSSTRFRLETRLRTAAMTFDARSRTVHLHTHHLLLNAYNNQNKDQDLRIVWTVEAVSDGHCKRSRRTVTLTADGCPFCFAPFFFVGQERMGPFLNLDGKTDLYAGIQGWKCPASLY
jgi:hypothetical protein